MLTNCIIPGCTEPIRDLFGHLCGPSHSLSTAEARFMIEQYCAAGFAGIQKIIENNNRHPFRQGERLPKVLLIRLADEGQMKKFIYYFRNLTGLECDVENSLLWRSASGRTFLLLQKFEVGRHLYLSVNDPLRLDAEGPFIREILKFVEHYEDLWGMIHHLRAHLLRRAETGCREVLSQTDLDVHQTVASLTAHVVTKELSEDRLMQRLESWLSVLLVGGASQKMLDELTARAKSGRIDPSIFSAPLFTTQQWPSLGVDGDHAAAVWAEVLRYPITDSRNPAPHLSVAEIFEPITGAARLVEVHGAICPRCLAKFQLMSQLVAHLREAHNIGDHRIFCDSCGNLIAEDSLDLHAATCEVPRGIHPPRRKCLDSPGNKLRCNHCEVEYPSKKSFLIHHETVHPNCYELSKACFHYFQRVFTCNRYPCQQRDFPGWRSLVNHLRQTHRVSKVIQRLAIRTRERVACDVVPDLRGIPVLPNIPQAANPGRKLKFISTGPGILRAIRLQPNDNEVEALPVQETRVVTEENLRNLRTERRRRRLSSIEREAESHDTQRPSTSASSYTHDMSQPSSISLAFNNFKNQRSTSRMDSNGNMTVPGAKRGSFFYDDRWDTVR
ncbi:unnamed protein product, partial [Mesorhabditis spiculigera]